MDGRTASDHVADVDVVVCWMQGLHTPREHSNMMSNVGSDSRQKWDHFFMTPSLHTLGIQDVEMKLKFNNVSLVKNF